MSEIKSLPEKSDVESASDASSTSNGSGWSRAARKVERSLGIEAQGVNRVPVGESFISLAIRIRTDPVEDQRDTNAKGWQAAEVWLS